MEQFVREKSEEIKELIKRKAFKIENAANVPIGLNDMKGIFVLATKTLKTNSNHVRNGLLNKVIQTLKSTG